MSEDAIDLALARAVLCRSLRWGLGPHDTRPREAGSRTVRLAAAALDEGDGPVSRAAALLDTDRVTAPAQLKQRHEAIFGHTLRGSVCPYETEYGGEALFRQGQELADIAGYYLAFGLRIPDDAGERVDHVACEFEFLEFLSLKEAWALETGDVEMLEVTRKAWRDFLRDHLGQFGRAFGIALARADDGGFHGALGHLCRGFIENECRRLGLPLGPDLLPLRPEDDGVPMACGSSCDTGEADQNGSCGAPCASDRSGP